MEGADFRAEPIAAESHFSQRIPTVCRAVVKLVAGRPSLLNVGFDDQASGMSRLWQPSTADLSRLAIQQNRIELTTSGAVGLARRGFRWSVDIKVPIWEQGL